MDNFPTLRIIGKAGITGSGIEKFLQTVEMTEAWCISSKDRPVDGTSKHRTNRHAQVVLQPFLVAIRGEIEAREITWK